MTAGDAIAATEALQAIGIACRPHRLSSGGDSGDEWAVSLLDADISLGDRDEVRVWRHGYEWGRAAATPPPPPPRPRCLQTTVGDHTYFVAGYWNTSHGRIAVVAALNRPVGDWAAYIGGVAGRPILDTVVEAAYTGGKLVEAEALRWFGDEPELRAARRGYRA